SANGRRRCAARREGGDRRARCRHDEQETQGRGELSAQTHSDPSHADPETPAPPALAPVPCGVMVCPRIYHGSPCGGQSMTPSRTGKRGVFSIHNRSGAGSEESIMQRRVVTMIWLALAAGIVPVPAEARVDRITAIEAAKHVGEQATVCGSVVSAKHATSA